MADKIKSIYVDEMIDWWAYVNLCPIVDGKIDYLADHPLNEGIWSKEGSRFLSEHFGDGIRKDFKMLTVDQEYYFVHLAENHSQMWNALRDYVEMLHTHRCEFSDLMHYIARQMINGEHPFGNKRSGARSKGANAKYKWRDYLISHTVIKWRDDYPDLPVKSNESSSQLSICGIVHAALEKVQTRTGYVPQPDRIYRIWRDYMKEADAN